MDNNKQTCIFSSWRFLLKLLGRTTNPRWIWNLSATWNTVMTCLLAFVQKLMSYCIDKTFLLFLKLAPYLIPKRIGLGLFGHIPFSNLKLTGYPVPNTPTHHFLWGKYWLDGRVVIDIIQIMVMCAVGGVRETFPKWPLWANYHIFLVIISLLQKHTINMKKSLIMYSCNSLYGSLNNIAGWL